MHAIISATWRTDKPPVRITLRKRIFSPRASLYIALPQLMRGIVYYLRSRGERTFYFSTTAAATAQHPGNSYCAISLQSISSRIALNPFPPLASWEMSISRRKNVATVYFSIFGLKVFFFYARIFKSSWFIRLPCTIDFYLSNRW